ncbi:MAG TPA: hypothetical protein VF929_08450 [Gemmatimonadaceae bacterium]
MNHIDVSTVLRQTLSCELYSNLVTRPTGAAVRTQIEALVADTLDHSLTVIDFSHVGMIDFSCADEVVAKLLLQYVAEDPDAREAYFLFRGVTDDHWDAIETVLERHSLALVLETDDGAHVMGQVNDGERMAWEKVYELGRAVPADIAIALGAGTSEAERVLEILHRRRLVMRLDDGYVAVGGLGETDA